MATALACESFEEIFWDKIGLQIDFIVDFNGVVHRMKGRVSIKDSSEGRMLIF